MYSGMLGQNGFGLSDTIAWQITNLHIVAIITAYALVVIVPFKFGENDHPISGVSWAYRLSNMRQLGVVLLMIIAVSKMIAQSFSPFLYFQF